MRRRRAKYVTLVTDMRCPSCGTDNAQDSRFCGGCGARFAMTGSRVAPTQKIADDASYPQRQLAPAGSPAGSAVPVTAPGIVAPRAIPGTPFLPHGAPSAQSASSPQGASSLQRPLGAGSVTPRPVTAAPNAQAASRPIPMPDASPGGPAPSSPRRPQIAVIDDPSLSLPIAARRPWGLIFTVLVIDLGLAVAGALMLTQGLR